MKGKCTRPTQTSTGGLDTRPSKDFIEQFKEIGDDTYILCYFITYLQLLITTLTCWRLAHYSFDECCVKVESASMTFEIFHHGFNLIKGDGCGLFQVECIICTSICSGTLGILSHSSQRDLIPTDGAFNKFFEG